MQISVGGVDSWARQDFGTAKLGDARRTARVLSIVRSLHRKPSGRVSQAFRKGAERQGAYDLLESGKVRHEDLLASMAQGCVARASSAEGEVLVPIDGTSIRVVDRTKRKDFGVVGSYRNGGRGIKVMTALALDSNGVPFGIAAQRMWSRPTKRPPRKATKCRPDKEKESRYWGELIDECTERFAGTDVKLSFLCDREADARPALEKLQNSGHNFIVRACRKRLLVTPRGKKYLHDVLASAPVRASYVLNVPAGYKRSARNARMSLRVVRVTLSLYDHWKKKRRPCEVTAIWVRERNAPKGEKGLDWVLLTNKHAETVEDALAIVATYAKRWRIEEFHKTWKSGACDVESSQLRSRKALLVWATLLASVAIRIERLKRLSRSTPDEPATIELTNNEIRAVIVLKEMEEIGPAPSSDAVPTIQEAVLWIAELGGYTGKSSGGPPGSITIQRGMVLVRQTTKLLAHLKSKGRIR
jgi:hypothetical protein